MPETTIEVAGQRRRLRGTHAECLRAVRGQPWRPWRADRLPVVALARDLPAGSLCLDVGAHVGLMSVAIAATRPDCQVIAFEPAPAPAAYACLVENIAGLPNASARRLAVGATRGQVEMSD